MKYTRAFFLSKLVIAEIYGGTDENSEIFPV